MIRQATPAEIPLLRDIFLEAIETLTAGQYSAVERAAWMTGADDIEGFHARMAARQPFVALKGGRIAGYSDLQPDGLIDHFFVAPFAAGRGVGRAMLEQIERLATAKGLTEIHAHISLTAEPFFLRNGFVIVERGKVERAGVVLKNALMRKVLVGS
ncbi:MAG: GNAT family N-acetyltransferase [Planctomyces sp.]|nr:GNAT family N-acetyltransferase [Planctomyces sp.]